VAPKFYEDVICQLLLRGVKWQYVTRNFTHNKSENVTKHDLSLKLDGLEEGKVPLFESMVPNRLYYSLSPSYPAADILYKTVDGTLVIIQVNRKKEGSKMMLKSALKNAFWQVEIDRRSNKACQDSVSAKSCVRVEANHEAGRH
jgi:hypothetical protein